jgi:hypothetical protein
MWLARAIEGGSAALAGSRRFEYTEFIHVHAATCSYMYIQEMWMVDGSKTFF